MKKFFRVSFALIVFLIGLGITLYGSFMDVQYGFHFVSPEEFPTEPSRWISWTLCLSGMLIMVLAVSIWPKRKSAPFCPWRPGKIAGQPVAAIEYAGCPAYIDEKTGRMSAMIKGGGRGLRSEL